MSTSIPTPKHNTICSSKLDRLSVRMVPRAGRWPHGSTSWASPDGVDLRPAVQYSLALSNTTNVGNTTGTALSNTSR